ncbi:MAG: hypothetical protein H0T86_13355, partial [Gemmatimonadales bacterium]|nr:hypothetical protein [Gemmatimonadales bacterium]
MPTHRRFHAFSRAALALVAIAACESNSSEPTSPGPSSALPLEDGIALDLVNPGELLPFTPLPQSAACLSGGAGQQLLLPTGYVQTLIASEGPTYPDLADMMTVNETGANRGRFLYRTHELTANGAVTVTDLVTGFTSILAQRADW